MIKLRSIYRLLLLLAVSLNFHSLSAQVRIKGSLWDNGNEAECNWYFKDHLACMELISKEPNGTSVHTRIVLNAQTKQMTISTTTTNGVNCLTVSADSIRSNSNSSPRFIPSKEEKIFDGFGSCKKVQSKSHEQESLLFYFEHNQINLGQFSDFLKNDTGFTWLSQNTTHGFPVQSITVDALGNLQRSYLAISIVESVEEGVFEVECK
jgi:hypothetical protein